MVGILALMAWPSSDPEFQLIVDGLYSYELEG
jgi:hypothetical protein